MYKYQKGNRNTEEILKAYAHRIQNGKVKTKNLFQFYLPPWLILLAFTNLRTANPFNFARLAWRGKKERETG